MGQPRVGGNLPAHNSAGVIYYGIDVGSYPFRREPGSYLLFVGRMAPEKGPVTAIEVARRAGRPLLMAGKSTVTSAHGTVKSDHQKARLRVWLRRDC